MAIERIEVEVLKCPCGAMVVGEYCCGVQNVGTVRVVLANSSLAAAQIRLARACVRLVTVGDSIPKEGENPERTSERYDAAIVDYQQALAAVRESAPPRPGGPGMKIVRKAHKDGGTVAYWLDRQGFLRGWWDTVEGRTAEQEAELDVTPTGWTPTPELLSECGTTFDAIRAELAAPPAPEAKCPACEGNGFTLETVNECCGHGTPSGDCCGDPVPGQEQVGCERCQTTGKVATPPAPEDTE